MRASRITRLFVIIAVAAAMLAVVPARRASAQDAQAALDKANAYIELAKSTERAVESWERYQSWVNIKTGPTGKEQYIDYGMYDVSDPANSLKDARAALSAEPKSEKLDATMARYMAAYEALAPPMNDAAAYYDAKGYQADKAAKGQELHKTMVPLATAFLASREAMLAELRPFVRDVEGQELATNEARDGRNAAWHVGQVMHAANRVFDVFPRIRPQPMSSEMMEEQIKALGPGTPGEKFDQIIAGVVPPQTTVIDVKAFGEALEKYAAAVKVFEGFNGEKPDDFDEFKPLPGKMLAMLAAFHKPLKKSQGREFEGGGQMAGQMMQVYIDMQNASSPLAPSQLRYLP